jgi:hypothetical protein
MKNVSGSSRVMKRGIILIRWSSLYRWRRRKYSGGRVGKDTVGGVWVLMGSPTEGSKNAWV